MRRVGAPTVVRASWRGRVPGPHQRLTPTCTVQSRWHAVASPSPQPRPPRMDPTVHLLWASGRASGRLHQEPQMGPPNHGHRAHSHRETCHPHSLPACAELHPPSGKCSCPGHGHTAPLEGSGWMGMSSPLLLSAGLSHQSCLGSCLAPSTFASPGEWPQPQGFPSL